MKYDYWTIFVKRQNDWVMANIPDEPLDPLVVVFLLQQSTIIDKNIKSQNNKYRIFHT